MFQSGNNKKTKSVIPSPVPDMIKLNVVPNQQFMAPSQNIDNNNNIHLAQKGVRNRPELGKKTLPSVLKNDISLQDPTNVNLNQDTRTIQNALNSGVDMNSGKSPGQLSYHGVGGTGEQYT